MILYSARLEKAVLDHPDDSKTRILYLKLLLADVRMTKAAAEARAIAALNPGAVALADAGHALNKARQYGVAKEVLEPVAGAPEVEIDLAVATFHATVEARWLPRRDCTCWIRFWMRAGT